MRLVDRLNQETGVLHAEVDNELVIHPISARAYQRYLACTYGFVAPLERSVTTTTDIEQYVDLRRFGKQDLLRRDLLSLHYSGAQIDALPQCSVPLFDTPAEALGWTYFIERSTLAHGAAFRAIASQIPGEVAFASSYLKCYFGAVGEMWRAFAEALDRVHEGDAAVVIEAAHNAFRFYRSWCEPSRADSTGSLRLAALERMPHDDDVVS